jgi:hypothetical protein
MIPELSVEELSQLRSQAERKVYEACRDQLDNQWTVVHSVAILKLQVGRPPQDGEADFVLFNPTVGIGVVEAKGGAIEFDSFARKWYSTSATGIKYPIKDPYLQALGQKKEIAREFVSHPTWKARVGLQQLATAHGVFFPDCTTGPHWNLPHVVPQITGWQNDLPRFSDWISELFDFWKGQISSYAVPGTIGTQIFEDIYCRSLSAKPLLAAQLEAEESVRLSLTQQQARLLRAIKMKKQALVCGGAGTGKTLLAMERSRELASTGLNTLLVCYNRPLADHLARVAEGTPNLQVMTYHALCLARAETIQSSMRRNLIAEAEALYPTKGYFECHLPYALAASVELSDWRLDAIVVDEAQDFKEDFWFGLMWLLKDPKESTFYVFYDHNQSLYASPQKLPIAEEPFLLTRNCRNTKVIHDLAYHFYTGEPTDGPEIVGQSIQEICATGFRAQATKIHAEILRLVQQERVPPEQIAVLVATSSKEAYYRELTAHPLPRWTGWAIESNAQPNSVLVETAPRFKGLESAIVFLWGIDQVDLIRDCELLYVGLSRAKSALYLVSTQAGCAQIKSALPSA